MKPFSNFCPNFLILAVYFMCTMCKSTMCMCTMCVLFPSIAIRYGRRINYNYIIATNSFMGVMTISGFTTWKRTA